MVTPNAGYPFQALHVFLKTKLEELKIYSPDVQVVVASMMTPVTKVPTKGHDRSVILGVVETRGPAAGWLVHSPTRWGKK